jgi:hypothetical protein
VTPRVELRAVEGVPLEEAFEASVFVGERCLGTARGVSKKTARLNAVRLSLEALESEAAP